MSRGAYESYRLWLRVYDERVITEEGLRLKDEVPEEYKGSELEIQYNQILVFADDSGQFREFRVMEFEGLKDQDNNAVGGYTYEIYGQTISVSASPPKVQAEWKVAKFNPEESTLFTAEADFRIDKLYRLYLAERGDIDS